MRALRLFAQLSFYYALLAIVVFAALKFFPAIAHYLPIGGAESLINQPVGGNLLTSGPDEVMQATRDARAENVGTLGESLIWVAVAIIGALLTALPTSWVYMEIRIPEEYDQSLIGTIVMLPIVVTGIVIIVQNSLALAFSLAGIAGAVRFRNSLKSTGDALFILLAVGIGLSAGTGALELAIVMSVVFNYCFLALWLSEYGERKGMKRYMTDVDPADGLGPIESAMPPAGAVSPPKAADPIAP